MADAPTVVELRESRKRTTGLRPSAELVYRVDGTFEDAEARSAVEGVAPITYDGMVLNYIELEPMEDSGVGRWRATAHYTYPGGVKQPEPPPRAPGETTISIDTTGGTQRMTQSLENIARLPLLSAPDLKGAVGLTPDGPEGVEIYVPTFKYQETRSIPAAYVTEDYIRLIKLLTGKANSEPFRIFNAGECLFIGATMNYRSGTDLWEITYQFLGSDNRSDFTVGGISVLYKAGWDYLWVMYKDQVVYDTDGTTPVDLVKQPKYVYIERVYDFVDLNQLDLDVPEAPEPEEE